LKAGHLYPFISVHDRDEKRELWVVGPDGPAPDTDTAYKAFMKHVFKPRVKVESDFSWDYYAGPPFHLAVGSSWTAAFAIAPVLRKHNWLTGEQLKRVQDDAVRHLASGGRTAFVEKWLFLHGDSDKIFARLKDREEPGFKCLTEDLVEDFYESYWEFFTGAWEAQNEAPQTSTCFQFFPQRNYFPFEVDEEDSTPATVATEIRHDMAIHLPERFKLYKEAQVFGSNITNVWARDNPEWGRDLHRSEADQEAELVRQIEQQLGVSVYMSF
jgi:hypothetical protein